MLYKGLHILKLCMRLNVNFKVLLAAIYFFLYDNYMLILFTNYEQTD
jgi:hypothetical protein